MAEQKRGKFPGGFRFNIEDRVLLLSVVLIILVIFFWCDRGPFPYW